MDKSSFGAGLAFVFTVLAHHWLKAPTLSESNRDNICFLAVKLQGEVLATRPTDRRHHVVAPPTE